MWLGIAVFLLIVSLILVVLFFKYQENVLKIISLVGLLISAISFLFSVISANQNQSVNNDISHNTEVQTEATSTEAEVKDDNYSTEDQDENEEYDVMGSGDSSGENEWTNAFSDESEETQKESVDEAEEPYSEGSKDALEIAPIIYSACTAEVIEDMFFEVQPVNIIELPDEITNVGQSKEYEYIPSISGMHRFEFSDVPNGTDFNITILNSGWEQLKKEYNLDNGGGLTYSLTAGETYHIRVEQYRGVGSYKLNTQTSHTI